MSPDPGRTPAPRQGRLDIQGLRGVAILLVVVFHAGLPLPGGFVGVDIFFAISGFVITAMLLREKGAAGRVDFRAFFVRRFLRLAPPLAVAVGFTALASALVLSPLGTLDIVVATGFGALLMFANVAIAGSTGGYFNPAAETNPLLHMWTLSLEGQFYLVFALLLLLGWRVARRAPAAPAVLVGAATVASFALAVLLEAGVAVALPEGLIGFYGLLGRSWEFGVGALVAMLALRLPPLSMRNSRALAIGGLFLITLGVIGSSAGTVYPGLTTVLPVGGTALLLYSGRAAENPIARVLALGPLVFIGNVSYSWYLWHWPLIVLANALWPGVPAAAVLAALLSLVPAVLSYRWIEQRFRPAAAPQPLGLRTAVLTLVGALVVVAALLGALRADFWSPRVAALAQSQKLHAGNDAGCLTPVPIDDSTAADCTWNAESTGTPVYLIGDSIAEHYSEGLIEATAQRGMPLTIATAPGCPPYRISSADGTDLTEVAGCTAYIEGTLSWLDGQPPGIVVIGAADLTPWMPSPGIASADPIDYRHTEFFQALTTTVERLEADGHEVVLAKAPPNYRTPAPGWRPRDCSLAVINADRCSATLSLESVDNFQGQTREIITVVASTTGAAVFDARSYFCDESTCSTERDGIALYLDDMHISVAASRQLTPLWLQTLTSID